MGKRFDRNLYQADRHSVGVRGAKDYSPIMITTHQGVNYQTWNTLKSVQEYKSRWEKHHISGTLARTELILTFRSLETANLL